MSTHHSEDRLASLRGPLAPEPCTARGITALTANPGCSRRAVLDAAGVDKATLAARLGRPAGFGQSPFALARGRAFEAMVKADGYAELLTLLREHLDIPVTEVAVADLGEVGGSTSPGLRARETEHLLDRLAAGVEERLLLDHPVLPLEVAGRTAFLEPDAVAHRVAGRFHVVEIKSFAVIDGQADPAKTAEAAKQAAVYIIALRRLLERLGHDPALVAPEFLLICPKDFSQRPVPALIDVRQEIEAIGFQLSRLRRADDLARPLPADATLDLSVREDGTPARTDTELTATVAALDTHYTPDCPGYCDLARHCRAEAVEAARPERLGGRVRDDLPGIDSTRTALRLIDSPGDEGEPVDPDSAEVVERLRAAARLYDLRRPPAPHRPCAPTDTTAGRGVG
ncbi:hypothetical protein FNQ90_05145 [Streptomyces alkaliphilus]|uniref:Secreted protein n=1 Tax=Streptomyces alkaliphilus TaxID=1472722 RepID=A0A7W3TAZ9_9ACTN|nr:hypothetical protein [Streptomyces alkaliphilus]MBB0243509.1 hypothetical protein [Streptomyces alkaliphilus]